MPTAKRPAVESRPEWTEPTHARGGVIGLMRAGMRAVGHRRYAAPVRRTIVAADRLLYRCSGGRWTTSAMSRIPSLVLVLERPDGGRAAIPLQYISIDGAVYVVGTNWGRPEHPLWSGRLRRDGDCVVNIGGDEVRCHAQLVEGHERDALWPRLVAKCPYYGRTQQRCRRQLRVFRLTPVQDAGLSATAIT